MNSSNIEAFSGVPESAVQAVRRGLAKLGVPQTEVRVPENFASEVRMLTGLTSYDEDRGAGTVGAKTIKLGDSSSLVVVNWQAVKDLEVDQIVRLLAHEACHVLMNDRDEVVTPFLEHIDKDSDYGFTQLAFVVAEEYRAECELYLHGFAESESSSQQQIEDSLYDYLGSIVLATTLGEDPYQMHSMLWKAVDSLTKPLSYLAAATTSGAGFDPGRLSGFGDANWREFVQPVWAAWTTVCSSLPPASQALLPHDNSLKTVSALAQTMREFVGAAGFAYDDLETGLAVWGTEALGKLDERLARFQQDSMRRGLV